MATFKSRVEQYVGPADHSLSSLLTQAARSLIDIIPPQRAELFSLARTDNGDGVPVEGNRFVAAYKNGRPAALKPARLHAALTDTESIHYATAFSPAVIIKAGTAYVFPGGGTIHFIPYPTVDEEDSQIDHFPDAFDSLVVIGTAQQRVLEKLNERTDDDDVELAGPLASLRDRLDAERQSILGTLFPQTRQAQQ